MSNPLLLVHVPGEIQHLYQTLTTFITEQCGLSIRYVSSSSFQSAAEATALKNKIRDALLNNNSLRMKPSSWELDKDGKIAPSLEQQFDRYPQITANSSKFRFKVKPPKPIETLTNEINQLVHDALSDRCSMVKLIGLDVARPKTDADKVMIPIWGWGLSAAESDECKDREIKFIFSDERVDSAELHVACLLHSLIEACWWYPLADKSVLGNQLLPQAASDDTKKLISCIVDENLCYCSMNSVVLLQRLQLFDQHFEDKERAHTPNQCVCQKMKTYKTSIVMKKVASIKNVLCQTSLDATEFHDWLRTHIEQSDGPDPLLRLYLGLLQQEYLEPTPKRGSP